MCRGSPPKAEKAMTENQKAEKSVGALSDHPPKADKAIPGKSKASTKVRAFHFIFDTLCYDMQ